MRRAIPVTCFRLAIITACAGCGNSETTNPVDSGPPKNVIVFNGENEHLNAYDPYAGTKQRLAGTGNEMEQTASLPALNGQICIFPDGSKRLVMGDDGGQPNPPPHWAIMQLTGDKVGSLTAQRVATITPTYQTSMDTSENYGCGFLKDGRMLTTDVGNEASGSANGQLIVWFPPFDSMSHYCKLDVAIWVAQGMYVDDQERIYVAAGKAGVYRYTGPFPTGDDAAHGCDSKDMTGAPMATNVKRELFIATDGNLPSPSAIVPSGHGTFYVSSVINGVIAEYDQNGKFVRKILQPPKGEVLGANPYSTGTPLGLGIDSAGVLYYADIALESTTGGIDIAPNQGTVRSISFDASGNPQPPKTIDTALNFPDGIGIWEP